MNLKIYNTLEDKHFNDINPVDCGVEQCISGHSFGPYVRRYYLLHYVLSGKGTFYTKSKTYHLSAGQFFLIYPDEVTTYTADEKDPWTYIWVGFTGSLSKRFDSLTTPVGELPSATFRELLGMLKENFPGWSNMREEYVTTVVHRIMALLFAKSYSVHNYANRVETYIRSSYMRDITVQEIAEEMSVDRRYLSRLFKKRYGVGIQEYIISVRMENAAKFLSDGYSVNESCDMCGYKDRSNFSKMFYRRYRLWPSQYVKQLNL
ncbi:MAG: AraC family transcriptional regulator [Clostridia bacterium]|nr:AraC family transcriptional regulator [Clostridia bacterium]